MRKQRNEWTEETHLVNVEKQGKKLKTNRKIAMSVLSQRLWGSDNKNPRERRMKSWHSNFQSVEQINGK